MQKVLASSHAGGQFDVTMQYYRPCSVGLSDDFPERLYYLLSEGADYLQLPLSKIHQGHVCGPMAAALHGPVCCLSIRNRGRRAPAYQNGP